MGFGVGSAGRRPRGRALKELWHGDACAAGSRRWRTSTRWSQLAASGSWPGLVNLSSRMDTRLLQSEMLPFEMTEELEGGRRIRCGIEFNAIRVSIWPQRCLASHPPERLFSARRPVGGCAISPERDLRRWATLRRPATWQSIWPGPLKRCDERPSSARSGAAIHCGVRWFRALEWLARGALARERRSRPYLYRSVSAASSSSHAAVSRSSSCSSIYSSGRALRSGRLP